jgi:hypothetical protein
MKKKFYKDLGERLTKVWHTLVIDKEEMAEKAGLSSSYACHLLFQVLKKQAVDLEKKGLYFYFN